MKMGSSSLALLSFCLSMAAMAAEFSAQGMKVPKAIMAAEFSAQGMKVPKAIMAAEFSAQGMKVPKVAITAEFRAQGKKVPRVFDVTRYGAVADGMTDNAEAFSRAWNDACEWKGRSRVWIPRGTYMLSSVVFTGPCWEETQFVIKGVLKAPINPALFFTDHWISFRYVDRLMISGGGYLDGQGVVAWPLNDCFTNSFCRPLPTSLRFDFITNSRVHHIRSINSKNAHFNLFACKNMNISHVRLTTPETSPNTDGIRIGDSNNIMIRKSVIQTGDDCIAMISGSKNIDITEVHCGPGHGFSIGSLGKGFYRDDTVDGITITNCTLRGTQNGLRIKTWAPSSSIIASNFVFQNIVMDNVDNPIIIDQQYCPSATCDRQAQSRVQISNVTFRNIWGTSSTQNAVTLKCSGLVPCKNVNLININLAYNGPGGEATSSCINVNGQAYGKQFPSGCL